jgi:hypothetical protein
MCVLAVTLHHLLLHSLLAYFYFVGRKQNFERSWKGGGDLRIIFNVILRG